MNETNPHSKNNTQKKREIEKNIKEKKLRFPNLSHLYLEISRKAANLLVKHEKNRKNLENGYSNLLELISITLEIEPILPKNGKEREKETLHLWKNRELCNEAMSHYVRQIQNLREKKHRRFTLGLGFSAIGISIFLPILLKFCLP